MEGSVPTTRAETVSWFEKLTSISVALSTTWKFVTMWPSLSRTNPEPSACCSCPGTSLPKASVADAPLEVEVIWTTPGAFRR